jgi:spore coat protein CotH
MRVPSRWRHGWTLLLMASTMACAEDPEHVCSAADPWNTGEVGDACPSGPVDCRWDLGCHDASCGDCRDGSECRTLDGCLPDGSCGACTDTAHCVDGEVCRSGFCLPQSAPAWDLTVAPGDWEQLHVEWYLDTWFPCTLTVGDRVYDEGCDVRSYGATSRTYPKKSFRIRFPEDRDHPGYSRNITLRAEYNDRTYMRTFLGYETFRRLSDIPTPRTRHVMLSTNGEVYGLMLELEQTGGKFLESRGRDRYGSMYEAEHAPPFGALVPMPTHDDYAVYEEDVLYNKKTGDPDDHSDLIELVEEVLWQDYLDSGTSGPTHIERTAGAVDVDSQVTYLVIQAMLQNRDHVAANYHIALQRDESFTPTWEVYPYDLDTSFGCVFDEVDLNNICDELAHDVWWLNGVIPEGQTAGAPTELWANLLIHLVLGETTCQERFNERLCGRLAGEYWNERLPDLILALQETLADSVAADPNDLNDGLDDFDASIAGLQSFLVERQAYLESQLECGVD